MNRAAQIENLQYNIAVLEGKDTWTPRDYELMRYLQRQLHNLTEQELRGPERTAP